jgi:hypothetical protein
MRLTPLTALLCLTAAAFAQDAQLDALHATLVSLHAHGEKRSVETSGATPELTLAKHQIRDWIETQLASLTDLQHLQAFSDRINQDLKRVDAQGSRDDENWLGSVGQVRFSSESGLLIVTTALGILCQYDESAYVYERVNGHWQRVLESEQNDYSPKKYTPQQIMAVHVSRSFIGGPAFVMTLGNGSGCASSWHSIYYRVWRVDLSAAKLLIDGSELAFLRVDTYAEGSIGQDRTQANSPPDVLIEFTQAGIDGVREGIRHYLIDGDQVRRFDPVALSPRDFVDEWLRRPWSDSAIWSASPDLRRWRPKLPDDAVSGQFAGVTMHCETADLYQVAFEPFEQQKSNIYFLVRWRPPYRFTMVDISGKPWPRCTQEDPEADQWRTLFSNQEWRQ